MAAASGLSLLNTNERDAIRATSIGTGDLIRTALNAGVTSIVLGIGGSATTDGGAGLLTGLGAVADRDSATADLSGLDERLGTVGAAGRLRRHEPAVRTDRRGRRLRPAEGRDRRSRSQELDRRLARFADSVERRRPAAPSATPRAPARPAASATRCCRSRIGFARSACAPGVDLVMDATDFDARLARADLVITGEGRIDSQTAFGKTALGVARRAQAAGVPCIAVGGGVEPEGIEALAAVGAIAVPVVERPQTVAEAMAAGVEPLIRCGERLARLTAERRWLDTGA